MLVLSRRVDQEIVFPNTGISLKLLQVRGQVVKVGIEAPAEVRVLRKEACSSLELQQLIPGNCPSPTRHQIRNHLNAINLAMHLFQKFTEMGRYSDAQATFNRMMAELASLDSLFGTTRPASAAEASPVKGRKLLVVDDDDCERDMLVAILELYGFHVRSAVDGCQALLSLKECADLDGILLDIRMPNCDGIETLHQIRDDKLTTNLKVYAMTGLSGHESDFVTRPQGFDGWFAKPLDPDRVIAAVMRGFSAA